MSIKLVDKLRAMSLTKLSWSKFTKEVSSIKDGEDQPHIYLRLELDDVIEQVIGSNTIYDPISERRINLRVNDVTEIYVSLDTIAKYEKDFNFEVGTDEELSGPGSYKGDLFLDVAKNDHVWLTDEKMSKKSQEFKSSKRNERLSSLIKRYNSNG